MSLRLLLIHGRFDPDEQLEEWGFNGPDIEGIEALHSTYETHRVVRFKDRAAAQRAHALTAWEWWDENALLMQFHDDMLKTTCISADGPAMYFGDFELQAVQA